MIKKALEYIVGLKKPEVIEIEGNTYSDKELSMVSYTPYARAIEMSTLTSLVDYIKANIDTMADKMIIHVESPTKVRMYSSLDGDRKREYLVEVNANLPSFQFGKFIEHEEFCIALQSKFISNDDRELVLKFAGTVEDGTVAQYGDDGVTQKATVKTGLTSKADAVVPNPVNLMPYRTFLEVKQPASDFIFRMKSSCGVQCAIFEADGGAWQNEAMRNIKEYLEAELADLPQFIVIS